MQENMLQLSGMQSAFLNLVQIWMQLSHIVPASGILDTLKQLPSGLNIFGRMDGSTTPPPTIWVREPVKSEAKLGEIVLSAFSTPNNYHPNTAFKLSSQISIHASPNACMVN